jgi:FdhD protein
MNQEAVRRVELKRFARGTGDAASDQVAREEPLEIQVNGVSLAVVMRTPGHDLDLVRGFLVTERIVEDAGQIESIRHCTEVADPVAEDNIVRATLGEGVSIDLERLRRNLFASSSCGICGKATLENALAVSGPLQDSARFPADALYGLPAQLRRDQPVFDATGGLHAAGLFGPDGKLLTLGNEIAVREDVGRHNAVDKVIGLASESLGLPLSGTGLMVSGRASFEVVQKALAARIPLVAAVSAPSSLAIELARDAGIALVGFLRDEGLNVYGATERVA